MDFDEEFRALMREQHLKIGATADAETMLAAYAMLLQAEKMADGKTRREQVALAFLVLLQASPAARAAIEEAKQGTTDEQRARLIAALLGSLFDVDLSGPMRQVGSVPA